MARQSAKGIVGSSSYRASTGAPAYPAAETGACGADGAAGAATLAAAPSSAPTGQPEAVAGVVLGAGAAIRAARLRDCGWALDRGDLRAAVGLLLEAVRGEADGLPR